MRKIALTAALAIVGLSACEKSISEPEGPMTGTWRYRAVDVVEWPYVTEPWRCTTEAYVDIVQTGNTIEGETRGTVKTCVNKDTGKVSDVIPADVVVRGEVQDGHVLLAFGNGYQNHGELHPQRIEGYVELAASVYPNPPEPFRAGEFVLTRE